MAKRALGAVLLAVLVVLSSPAATAERALVFGSAAGEPYVRADGSGYLQRLYAAIFAQLGMTVQVLQLPAERALKNANSGFEDGDAMRVGGLEAVYPNLVRIDEPIISMDFITFSARPNITIKDWSSLKPYVVALITGWKIAEKNTQGVREVTRTNNADQLFDLLDNGRADVAIYERWQGASLSARKKSKARVVDPPLASVAMYLYLHKKHAALVPQVREILIALKRDGTVDRIAKEGLRP